MDKILFITGRNIVSTCGELRLIKNRAIALQKLNITTDFIACTKKRKKLFENILDNCKTKIFFYRKIWLSVEFAVKKLKKESLKQLSNGYKAVIVSGAIVLPMIKYIKMRQPDIKVYADVHGALEEFTEYNGGCIKGFIRKTVYKKFKKFEREYLPLYDGIIAVSNGLKEYLIKEYNLTTPIYVSPCATVENKICKNFENRATLRAKYGVEDKKLFIYSGSVTPWECMDKTVELFNKIKNGDKLLILVTDKSMAVKYQTSDIFVEQVLPEEVGEILSCGDFAFMLRENNITNNVAYPNKFPEYISAGLKVIITPYVFDVRDAVTEYGLGFVFDNNIEQLKEYVNNDFGNTEKTKEFLESISFEKTLKFLSE